MKSIVTKSIYAGLGLLGSGKETARQLGRKLAHRANLSEKDGEKIARQLRARSERAIHRLNQTLATEVAKVVEALNAATKKHAAAASRKAKSRHHRRAKT